MAFLGQLYLPAVPLADGYDWLPRRGRLLFFYDAEQQTWGMEPEDRGSWQVIFVDETMASTRIDFPSALPASSRFKRKDIRLRTTLSRPGYERMINRFGVIDDEVLEHYRAATLQDDSMVATRHQLLGWPEAIQGDQMELECQFVSNGIHGIVSPAGAHLVAGAADWQLLLQLDSDEDIGMIWGDVGSLYFWVRSQDAVRGDFSNVWMVLQCY